MLANETLIIRPSICLAKVVLMGVVGRAMKTTENHEPHRNLKHGFLPRKFKYVLPWQWLEDHFPFCVVKSSLSCRYFSKSSQFEAIYEPYTKPAALITHKPFTDATNNDGFINHYPYQPWYWYMYTHINGWFLWKISRYDMIYKVGPLTSYDWLGL